MRTFAGPLALVETLYGIECMMERQARKIEDTVSGHNLGDLQSLVSQSLDELVLRPNLP